MPVEEEHLTLEFGSDDLSGIPAAVRINRAIVMIVREACQEVISAGWHPRHVQVVIDGKTELPAVELRGKRVFEILAKFNADSGKLSYVGLWVDRFKIPGVLYRLLNRQRK